MVGYTGKIIGKNVENMAAGRGNNAGPFRSAIAPNPSDLTSDQILERGGILAGKSENHLLDLLGRDVADITVTGPLSAGHSGKEGMIRGGLS